MLLETAMNCCRSALLVTLLVAVQGSDEVRRVGITATGRVDTSKAQASADAHANAALVEVSARAKSQAGLSFWRSLRKQLEAKNDNLGAHGLKYETAHAAWWNAVRKVDQRFNSKASCKLSENIAYHLVPIFSKVGITSPRDCALMCAVDPMAVRSGRDSSCKSFTYNSSSTECKFFKSGQPAKAEWVQSLGITSGPACNLESIRQEIQQTYEADLKRAVKSEQRVADELEKSEMRLAQQTKRAEKMDASLKKVQHDNLALKGEIVRSEKLDKGPAGKDLKSTHRHVQSAQKSAGTAVRKTYAKGAPAEGSDARAEMPKNLLLGICGTIAAMAVALRIHLFLKNRLINSKQEKQKPTTNDALVTKGS